MTNNHDDNAQSPLDPVQMEELSGLLARLCDDELSESDRYRINLILDENAVARRYYLRYVAVHSALAATACSPVGEAQLAVERLTLDRFAGCTTSSVVCGLETPLPDRDGRWRSVIRWAASLSAVLLVAAAASWWVQGIEKRDDKSVSIEVVKQLTIPTKIAITERLVAEVTYVSDSAMWQNPNSSYVLASSVRAGQSLSLERGQVELTYSSGAKLLLTGPSEFLVHPTGGKLRRGELVARVPEAGHGFTIETPHGKVVDLGTEFGVVVDDFGVSQVSVFEGKVETLPTGTAGRTQDKIELTTGRAIQWTESGVTPISVQGRSYRHANRDLPAVRSDYPTGTSIENDFREVSLDPNHWETLGVVLSSAKGLRLGGTTRTTQRPYLITAQEFDPARGAITVVCDLRFEDVYDAENASFAILTRSANQPSKPGKPWHDMLARSVRCRLKADPDSGEGILEAGTKYEADREQMNISWGGFTRPQPDTLYRLEMRDDGLNVSFTVSLAENPSIRKTITCRSLFRGNHNFIALEGSSTGITIVERLMISQKEVSPAESYQLAALSRDVSAALTFPGFDISQQLDQLAPKNATLIFKDDFNDGKLNSNHWITLGDVVLKDGHVQLGIPNDEQHIDTWRARPYLLTREQLDPADSTLIILGKATFSDNFLHGYGGSFAVMTRTDGAHGGGPGWQNSILRRGVRSNFWPAAYGFDHSLEIHEKPAPNSISLLVAEDFSIAPNSRSYLFRIVDDGHSASLTFIDASNSTICKTVSRPTSPAMQFGGHIGFESCWGSPVQLDDIGIFQVDVSGTPMRKARD